MFRRQLRADLVLLLVTATWGATFVMVKDAVASSSVFAFLAIRFGLASAAMLPLLRWPDLTRGLVASSPGSPVVGASNVDKPDPIRADERRKTKDQSVLRRSSFVTSSPSAQQPHTSSTNPLTAGALLGLFLFASYAFQTSGLQYTTPTKTAFITGLSVVLVPLLAALFWRKMVQPAAIVGVLLATAGLALWNIAGVRSGTRFGAYSTGLALLSLNGSLSVSRGDLLVLGCAVCVALHILTTGVFAPRADPIRLTAVQLLTVAVLSGLFALLWERPLALPSGSVWFAAAFTGLLASSFAFGAQTVAQRFTSATHTALIFVTEPVFAALFSYVVGGEDLTTRAWLGCGLILAGMLTAELGQPLLLRLRRR